MPNEFDTIVARYNESPEIIQQLVYYGDITNTASYISLVLDLQEHQKTALENEIVFLLLNLQTNQEFLTSLRLDFEIDEDQVNTIISIIERNLIQKIILATPELQEPLHSQAVEQNSVYIPAKAPALFGTTPLVAPAPITTNPTQDHGMSYTKDPAYTPSYEQNLIAVPQTIKEPVYQSTQPAPQRAQLSPLPSYAQTPVSTPSPASVAPDRPRWSTDI